VRANRRLDALSLALSWVLRIAKMISFLILIGRFVILEACSFAAAHHRITSGELWPRRSCCPGHQPGRSVRLCSAGRLSSWAGLAGLRLIASGRRERPARGDQGAASVW
jgi:hypothetical protein